MCVCMHACTYTNLPLMYVRAYIHTLTHTHALTMQGPMAIFQQPKLGAEIQMGTSAFSMTAWVKTVPQFLQGYILRKRPHSGSHLRYVDRPLLPYE